MSRFFALLLIITFTFQQIPAFALTNHHKSHLKEVATALDPSLTYAIQERMAKENSASRINVSPKTSERMAALPEVAKDRKVVAISAGGVGERLYPKGRALDPKQFVPLLPDGSSLFHIALKRYSHSAGPGHVLIVALDEFRPKVREVLDHFVDVNSDFVGEPQGADTFAAFLLAAIQAKMTYGDDAIIAFAPADHVVPENQIPAFHEAMNEAYKIADSGNKIVAVGIKPESINRNLGHLQPGHPIPGVKNAYEVAAFFEKPKPTEISEVDLTKAMEPGADTYFHNGGYYIAKVSTILEATKDVASGGVTWEWPNEKGVIVKWKIPDYWLGAKNIMEAWNTDNREAAIREVYSSWVALKNQIKAKDIRVEDIKGISIDFVLSMPIASKTLRRNERSGVTDVSLEMVKGEFKWEDIGTWESLSSYLRRQNSIKDGENLVTGGDKILVSNTDNSNIYGVPNRPLFVDGLSGVTVSDDYDATLVVPSKKDSAVKDLTAQMVKTGFGDYVRSRQTVTPKIVTTLIEDGSGNYHGGAVTVVRGSQATVLSTYGHVGVAGFENNPVFALRNQRGTYIASTPEGLKRLLQANSEDMGQYEEMTVRMATRKEVEVVAEVGDWKGVSSNLSFANWITRHQSKINRDIEEWRVNTGYSAEMTHSGLLESFSHRLRELGMPAASTFLADGYEGWILKFEKRVYLVSLKTKGLSVKEADSIVRDYHTKNMAIAHDAADIDEMHILSDLGIFAYADLEERGSYNLGPTNDRMASYYLGKSPHSLEDELADAAIQQAVGEYQDHPYPLVMTPGVQQYYWGGEWLRGFLNIPGEVKGPFAEIWYGAHFSLPALVTINGVQMRLDTLLALAAPSVIGEEMAKRFNNQLPVLLKISEANQPLSIQVHPPKAFKFPDPWAKAEAWFPITSQGLKAVAYIRPIEEIVAEDDGIKQRYEAAEAQPDFDVSGFIKEEMRKVLADEATRDQKLEIFLRKLDLRLGQGVYLPAGTPHAIMKGPYIEVQAPSDNVVRGGWTTKETDPARFIEATNFEANDPKILNESPLHDTGAAREFVMAFEPEFNLNMLELNQSGVIAVSTKDYFSLLVVGQGEVVVRQDGQDLRTLAKGQSVILPVDSGDYQLTTGSDSALVYQAYVKPPSASRMAVARHARPIDQLRQDFANEGEFSATLQRAKEGNKIAVEELTEYAKGQDGTPLLRIANVLLPTDIFKSNDLRADAKTQFSNETVSLVAQGYADFLLRKTGQRDYSDLWVAIGRDPRLDGPRVQRVFAKALRDLGVNVYDLSVKNKFNPTAVSSVGKVYFSSWYLRKPNGAPLDGAVEVTASHLTKEWIGIKPVFFDTTIGYNVNVQKPDTQAIRHLAIERLKKGYEVKEVKGKLVRKDIDSRYVELMQIAMLFPTQWDFYAQKVMRGEMTLEQAIETIKPQFERKKSEKPLKGLKIGVDAGHGAAGPFAVKMFRDLGAGVRELYTRPDGRFPAHHPDPTLPENMEDLRKVVMEEGLHLGVGYDTDSDRIGFVTAKGRIAVGDEVLAVLVERALGATTSDKTAIVYDAKSSRNLTQRVEELKGIPVRWKTGFSFIKDMIRRLLKRGIAVPLGGEQSGHMFFAGNFYNDDAIFASGQLVGFLMEKAKKVSAEGEIPVDIFDQILDSIIKWKSTPEIRVPIRGTASEANARKEAIAGEVVKYFVGQATDHPNQFARVVAEDANIYPPEALGKDIDGVLIEIKKGGETVAWFLQRFSNTEPVLILRAEGINDAERDAALRLLFDKVKEIGGDDIDWDKIKPEGIRDQVKSRMAGASSLAQDLLDMHIEKDDGRAIMTILDVLRNSDQASPSSDVLTARARLVRDELIGTSIDKKVRLIALLNRIANGNYERSESSLSSSRRRGSAWRADSRFSANGVDERVRMASLPSSQELSERAWQKIQTIDVGTNESAAMYRFNRKGRLKLRSGEPFTPEEVVTIRGLIGEFTRGLQKGEPLIQPHIEGEEGFKIAWGPYGKDPARYRFERTGDSLNRSNLNRFSREAIEKWATARLEQLGLADKVDIIISGKTTIGFVKKGINKGTQIREWLKEKWVVHVDDGFSTPQGEFVADIDHPHLFRISVNPSGDRVDGTELKWRVVHVGRGVQAARSFMEKILSERMRLIQEMRSSLEVAGIRDAGEFDAEELPALEYTALKNVILDYDPGYPFPDFPEDGEFPGIVYSFDVDGTLAMRNSHLGEKILNVSTHFIAQLHPNSRFALLTGKSRREIEDDPSQNIIPQLFNNLRVYLDSKRAFVNDGSFSSILSIKPVDPDEERMAAQIPQRPLFPEIESWQITVAQIAKTVKESVDSPVSVVLRVPAGAANIGFVTEELRKVNSVFEGKIQGFAVHENSDNLSGFDKNSTIVLDLTNHAVELSRQGFLAINLEDPSPKHLEDIPALLMYGALLASAYQKKEATEPVYSSLAVLHQGLFWNKFISRSDLNSLIVQRDLTEIARRILAILKPVESYSFGEVRADIEKSVRAFVESM